MLLHASFCSGGEGLEEDPVSLEGLSAGGSRSERYLCDITPRAAGISHGLESLLLRGRPRGVGPGFLRSGVGGSLASVRKGPAGGGRVARVGRAGRGGGGRVVSGGIGLHGLPFLGGGRGERLRDTRRTGDEFLLVYRDGRREGELGLGDQRCIHLSWRLFRMLTPGRR